MKSFSYWLQNKLGHKIEVVISADEKDYEWLHELFLRNENPLKILLDLDRRVCNETEEENLSRPVKS